KPEMAPVDLHAMVRAVTESVEPLLAGRELKVEVAAAGRPTVLGNAFLLHHALENLVQNAIDFSPSGGTVRVTVRSERDRETISIADEGPGIPVYALER